MNNLPIVGKFRITCQFMKKGNLWKAGYHTGIDIVADIHYIFATGDGKVTNIGYDKSYGNYIIIKIDNNFHWFCHLKTVKVFKGQNVTRETIIGEMGKTGNATGVHLHWEIRKECNCYGKVENPAEYAGIPNKIGTYYSSNYTIEKKYKNGDIIRIKALDTGAQKDNKVLVEVQKINQQFWVDINDFNYMLNELKVIVCAVSGNRILVEIKDQKQFWIDESDVIK